MRKIPTQTQRWNLLHFLTGFQYFWWMLTKEEIGLINKKIFVIVKTKYILYFFCHPRLAPVTLKGEIPTLNKWENQENSTTKVRVSHGVISRINEIVHEAI